MPALQLYDRGHSMSECFQIHQACLNALEASLVNLEQPNYLHVSVWMSYGNFVHLESFR